MPPSSSEFKNINAKHFCRAFEYINYIFVLMLFGVYANTTFPVKLFINPVLFVF